MIKTQNKFHLAILTYILILPHIVNNGIGNHVSLVDTSNLVNDVHNVKEKDKPTYEFQLSTTKSVYT